MCWNYPRREKTWVGGTGGAFSADLKQCIFRWFRVVCLSGGGGGTWQAWSLQFLFCGSFLRNMSITKERTFQVHEKRWHLNITNQMGIKYLKLKGWAILDLFSFWFFPATFHIRTSFLMKALSSLFHFLFFPFYFQISRILGIWTFWTTNPFFYEIETMCWNRKGLNNNSNSNNNCQELFIFSNLQMK